jgi:hypothetical protein
MGVRRGRKKRLYSTVWEGKGLVRYGFCSTHRLALLLLRVHELGLILDTLTQSLG